MNPSCLERITSRRVDMFFRSGYDLYISTTLPIPLRFGPTDALLPHRFLFQAPVSGFLMSMAMEIFVRFRPATTVILMGVGKVGVFHCRQG